MRHFGNECHHRFSLLLVSGCLLDFWGFTVLSRQVVLSFSISSLLLFSLASSAAGQSSRHAVKGTEYLALGDSLAFGYNPLIQPPDLSKYIGYPSLVSRLLHLKVANASCPGETSGTFAGTSSIYLPGFNCVPLQKSGLFVPYDGATSQLAYAVRYLQNNPNTKLVTLNIGENDLGVLQASCTAATPNDPAAIAACELAGLPAVLSTFGQNLTLIYSELRATGYTGTIVALNGFAFNYRDTLQVGALMALNQVISQVSAAFDVTVADTFGSFQIVTSASNGDACQASLLVRFNNGTCDTHPSVAGQTVLAASVLAAVELKAFSGSGR